MKYKDVSFAYLQSIGFEQIEHYQKPNMKDIAYRMSHGIYEVKIEDEVSDSADDSSKYEIMYYRVRRSYLADHPELQRLPNVWMRGLRRKKR